MFRGRWTFSSANSGVILPRVLVASAAILFLAGCPTPEGETCEDGPCWLELQSWLSVDEAGAADGFLRWVYGSVDPEADLEATADCETWERLVFSPVPVDPACRGCTHQFDGTATIDADDTTCGDATWDPWSITYAFGPLDGEDQGIWAEQGFTHTVQTRWSPDLGDTQGFQSLFVAIPEVWDGGTAGSEGTPAGEYALEALHFWDVR